MTVFDAASWNGIAIDSTCGGHGTCHKCKVQITSGAEVPVTRHDQRTFSAGQLAEAGLDSAAIARKVMQGLGMRVEPLRVVAG